MPTFLIDDRRPGAEPGSWVLRVNLDTEEVETPPGMSLALAIGIALNQAFDQGVATAIGTDTYPSTLS